MKNNYLTLLVLVAMALTSCTGKMYSYRKMYKADPSETVIVKKKTVKAPVNETAEAPAETETPVSVTEATASIEAAPSIIPSETSVKLNKAKAAPEVKGEKAFAKADVKSLKAQIKAAKKDIKKGSAIDTSSTEVRLIIAGLICILIAILLPYPVGAFIYTLGAILLVIGLILLLLHIL